MIDKVVVVFLAALAVTTALNVPLGFERVQKKYLVANSKASFLEAFITCKSHGYRIASVNSTEENVLLESVAAESTNYWIGGLNYDTLFNADWFWIDSGVNINFTNWAASEPILQPGINGLVFNSGLWYASNCSNMYKFICEI